MNTRFFMSMAIAGLMAANVALPVWAETAGETRNLFESAGQKQTNKDFKPAPDEIKTNFGID